jgi:Protein of unknwon function (DUF3310)
MKKEELVIGAWYVMKDGRQGCYRGYTNDENIALAETSTGTILHTSYNNFLCPVASATKSPLQTQEGGSHYKDMAIQPVEYIYANGLGFCEGAIIKYVSRWKAKNGLEDLKKAKHFIELLIELESKNGNKPTV